MMTQDQVLKALSYVDDPDLNKDLVTLGMIQKIEIDGHKVAFDLVLTTPACPMKESIARACTTAIHTMVSADADVQINITSNVQSSRENSTILSGIRNIIAVASGKGGVGKSTVAINLARTLSEAGAKVGLLDADIHGPSIPTLLGTQGQKPAMEGELMLPVECNGIKTMSIGYLVESKQALVWRGPMLSKAISQFCTDVKWGELDYLFVDLPPGTGDAHLSIMQHIPLSGVVIVTTPEEVAAVIGFRDAEAKAAAIEKATAEAQAAIEKMVLDALPDTPISRAVPISLAACLLLCRAKSALSRNIGHELRL